MDSIELRLGAYASVDTHARYVQYRVELSKQKGVMDDYSNEAFSVVSVDNVDFYHSLARIYRGKLQLSLLPRPLYARIITDSYKLNFISLITYLHVLLQSTHFVSKSVAMEFSQNLKSI